ncbi:hypothetical protein BTUL_0217g00090 [Botrytis tulipae]|uniref:Uncharacterized protein n=1 Tax=Botrytis tulipae TaxID=87230 RepID=A0A4Z1E843_9HELO|nr:hypothetical protein BTUL_0217g00090 [Botrytis tulipae]
MRSEKVIKDLLRHIARSLGQVLEPVENQGIALVPVTPFEKNRLAQQKESFNKYADKAPTFDEAC